MRVERYSTRGKAMTQQLTFVILSTGLETFKELRGALVDASRTRACSRAATTPSSSSPRSCACAPRPPSSRSARRRRAGLKFVERIAAECPQHGDHLRLARRLARSHPAQPARRRARVFAPARHRRRVQNGARAHGRVLRRPAGSAEEARPRRSPSFPARAAAARPSSPPTSPPRSARRPCSLI